MVTHTITLDNVPVRIQLEEFHDCLLSKGRRSSEQDTNAAQIVFLADISAAQHSNADWGHLAHRQQDTPAERAAFTYNVEGIDLELLDCLQVFGELKLWQNDDFIAPPGACVSNSNEAIDVAER